MKERYAKPGVLDSYPIDSKDAQRLLTADESTFREIVKKWEKKRCSSML